MPALETCHLFRFAGFHSLIQFAQRSFTDGGRGKPLKDAFNSDEVFFVHWWIVLEPTANHQDMIFFIKMYQVGFDKLFPCCHIALRRPAQVIAGVAIGKAIATGAVLMLTGQEVQIEITHHPFIALYVLTNTETGCAFSNVIVDMSFGV